jgi:hypothetical protein
MIIPLLLGAFLLAGCACSRDLVPDNVLEGLHKPVINSIRPKTIRVNDAGFYLSVVIETPDDADKQYVLYINERKVGQVSAGDPQYWRNSSDWMTVGWVVPKGVLSELLASSANSGAFSVRVTSINQNYDISAAFDRYRDYVSEPVTIEISKGETQFSEAKQLFPEWTHSRAPIIRSDASGNLYLAWEEKLTDVCQAFFSFSADGGETWSQVLNISRSSEWVSQIDLAVDGSGHFYLTWKSDDFYKPGSDVYFCRSLDGGATWNFPVRMNAAGEFAEEPKLAVSERGDLFLAWKEQSSGIRLAVSANLGNSWKTKDFAVSGQYFWPPLLAVRPGGLVHLFNGRSASGNDLSFNLHSSQDYGNTWQSEEFAVGNAYPDATHPLLRFGPGNQVNISWGAGTTMGRVASFWNHFLRRESSGAWAAIKDLGDFCPAADGGGVALSTSGPGVDVMMTGRGCLFLLSSADQGDTWPVPETVAGSEGYAVSSWPDMVFHPSGKTFLVFIRKTTANDGGLFLTSFE